MEKILVFMKNSIFFVAEYVNSSQNSTGYFWERLINHLQKMDFNINTIGGAAHGEYIRSKSVYTRFVKKIFGSFKLGVKVARFVNRDSILISGTNPEFLMLVLALLRMIIGFRWIVVVSDIFPDNTIPARILRPDSFKYKLMSAVFCFAYRKVDLFIVPGRDMVEIIEAKIRCKDKIFFIPYWVDVDGIIATSKAESSIINELGWQRKIVFQFFGNMGSLQDIENILAAIGMINDENLAFLFMGSGTMRESLKKFIQNNPNKCVHYYGEIPQNQKNKGLCACDIAIVSLASGMKGLAVPSKAYFSFAADKPILTIGDLNSELSLTVKESNVGWSCVSGDPGVLADTIKMIATLDLKEYVGRPRRLAEVRHSEATVLNQFVNILKNEIIK